MDTIAPYGMVTSFAPPQAPSPAGSPVADAGLAVPSAWQAGFSDFVHVNRWESSAIGVVLIIGFALYANALLDS